MKIDVYDTYGESKQGELIHFDVFIESGVAADKAYQYAMRYLDGIGEDGSQLKQERCNFCHSQSANPKVIESIKKYGYCILPMEGCPR